jgi:protein SCO1/2
MTQSRPDSQAPEQDRPGGFGRRAVVVAIVLAGLLVGYGAFLWMRPHTFAGTVLQSPSPAPPLTGLMLNTGEEADLSSFRGEVVLLYFGYTHCPDICPATLANVAAALDTMGPRGDDVKMLMITVDPARDDLRTLGEYVGHFHPRFLGVSGSEADIRSAATQYGVFFQQSEGSEATGYLVDHTASLMAIDPDGYLRVVYPVDVPVEALASDLEELLG